MRSLWLLILAGLAALLLVACGSSGDDSSIVPPGRIAFVSDRDGNQEIYIMNADGSGQVNLTQNAAPDEDPWWSPDGSRIGFKSMRGGQSDLWTMSADGDDVKRGTNDGAGDGQLRGSPGSRAMQMMSMAVLATPPNSPRPPDWNWRCSCMRAAGTRHC